MASTVDASAPPVTAAAVPVRPPKRRVVFRVVLNPSAPSEINFKELARSLADAAPPSTSSKDTNASNGTTDAALNGSAPGDEGDLSLVPTGPRSQRYNIIERLEKRYGGGAIVDCSESVGALDVGGASGGGGGGGGGFERGEEDDYYDSEDSFIDDEELQQNIEDIHGQAKVKTKHAGFFVNAGDEIETIERDETYVCLFSSSAYALACALCCIVMCSNSHVVSLCSDDIEDARSSKKNKKGGAESSKSVKGFLDEWSDAATDWSPEPEVITKLEILRNAVRERTCLLCIFLFHPVVPITVLRAAHNVSLLTMCAVVCSRTGGADHQGVPAHPGRRAASRRHPRGGGASKQVARERLLRDAHDVPAVHEAVSQGAAALALRISLYHMLTSLLLLRQSNMLRLEARDNARNVKDEMERVFQALSEQASRVICFKGLDCRWYISLK